MKTLGIASALLLLSACGQPEPIVHAPPAEWAEPVAEPQVPILSDDPDEADAQTADYITRLWDAFKAANNRLQRLKDWRAGIED